MKSIFHMLGAVALFLLAVVLLLVIPAHTVANFTQAKSAARQVVSDFDRFVARLLMAYRIRTSPWAQVFQSSVALDQGFGVIGEIIFEGPTRAEPGVLEAGAATAADILVGSFYTVTPSTGKYQPGSGGGVAGGILVNPKALQSIGTTSGGPLAPTLTVPAGTVGEILTMGQVVIALPEAANFGDPLYYVNATGVIHAGTASTGQTQIAGAKVVRYTNAAAGLAVVQLG